MKNQNYWNPWMETLERELLLEIWEGECRWWRKMRKAS